MFGWYKLIFVVVLNFNFFKLFWKRFLTTKNVANFFFGLISFLAKQNKIGWEISGWKKIESEFFLGQQNLSLTFFWVKKMWVVNLFGKKKCGSNKYLGQQYFWVKKCWSEISLGQKKFRLRFFWVKNNWVGINFG